MTRQRRDPAPTARRHWLRDAAGIAGLYLLICWCNGGVAVDDGATAVLLGTMLPGYLAVHGRGICGKD